VTTEGMLTVRGSVLQSIVVCCSVLQCVAVCCRVLQCVVVVLKGLLKLFEEHFRDTTQCVALYGSVVQCVAVCCSVLQCVAVCCCVLLCVADILEGQLATEMYFITCL